MPGAHEKGPSLRRGLLSPKTGPDYLVGFISDAPLPDGATQYMTVAAVLSPLTKGQHKVVISGLATGAALGGGEFEFATEYTVIVR